MKNKYDKCWGNLEKLNVLLFIALVIDPRYKMEFVDFSIASIYENKKVGIVSIKVKTTLHALFGEYKILSGCSTSKAQSGGSRSDTFDVESKLQVRNIMKARFKQHKAKVQIGDAKSELYRYLDEDNEDDKDESFDIPEC